MLRFNSEDKTIELNYLNKWHFLIREYEQIKVKKYPKFRFVGEFYRHYGIIWQVPSKKPK